MKAHLNIAHFAGIPLRFHWTFALVLLLIFVLSWDGAFSPVLFIWNLLFISSLFACVVLHEYGHALTAKRYGIKTQDILLTPIGGIARLKSMPSDPRQELLIALAGPLVNLLIAGLLLLPVLYFFPLEFKQIKSAFLSGALEVEDDLLHILRYWLPALLLLNLVLAGFNLLPAFPMDGGRILRALLSFKWNHLLATRIASRIGQIAGLAFIFIGYRSQHPGLIFIGAFVIFTAAQEYRNLYQYQLLSRQTTEQLMRPFVFCLSANDTLAHAKRFARQTQIAHLPVFQADGHTPGYFDPKSSKKAKDEDSVSQHITPWPQRLLTDDNLLTALHKLQSSRSKWLPVFKGQTLVGFLEKKKIAQLLKRAG